MKSASPSLWFWSLVSLLLAVVVALEVAWWMSMKPSAREEALTDNRRVAYNLTTGESLGNPEALMFTGEKPEAPPAKEEAAAEAGTEPEAEHPADAEATPEAPKAEAAAEHGSEHGEHPAPEAAHAPAHEEPIPDIKAPKIPTGVTAVASTSLAAPAGAEEKEIPTAPKSRWQQNAHAFVNPGHPMVSILIAGLGLSKSSTDQAFSLPSEVGLVFSPYGHNVRSWAEQAQAKNYEVYIELPMEPTNYPLVDPGPNALLTTLDAKEMEKRLTWVLERTPLYVGLVTPVEEKFTAHLESMQTLEHLLEGKDLLFFRSNPDNAAIFEKSMLVGNIPAFQSVSVIDAKISAESIDAELSALAREAESTGYAVAVARPYPVTLERLNVWLKGLKKRNIILVAPSAAGYVEKTKPAVPHAAAPSAETPAAKAHEEKASEKETPKKEAHGKETHGEEAKPAKASEEKAAHPAAKHGAAHAGH